LIVGTRKSPLILYIAIAMMVVCLLYLGLKRSRSNNLPKHPPVVGAAIGVRRSLDVLKILHRPDVRVEFLTENGEVAAVGRRDRPSAGGGLLVPQGMHVGGLIDVKQTRAPA
jgi:hypothetical protein